MVSRFRRSFPLLLVIGLLAFASACEKEPEAPAPPKITGSWQGTADEVTLTLSVFENDQGVVGGSGTLSSPQASFPFQVQGGHLFPDVALQLALNGEPDVLTYEAVVAFDNLGNLPAMDGALSGGGFDRFPISVTRR